MQEDAARARRSWRAAPKILVYLVIVVVVLASAAAAGYVLVRHDRGLVIKAYTDKSDYSPGEPVHVWVEFTNYGFDSIHMTFNTSRMALFSVYSSNGDPVTSIMSSELEVITHKTVGPGESLAYGVFWDQTTYDPYSASGEQVPYPASYYIVARAGTSEYGATVQTALFLISE